MSVPVIIIITPPPRPGARSAPTEQRIEFTSVSEAITYLQRLPTDELPAGDGSAQS